MLTLYAVVVTLLLIAVSFLHFRNPYPLIQIPDRGHRLYGVPEDYHDKMVWHLSRLGLEPFRTFRAGVRQTLFQDGMTVIASGKGMATAGLSLPCANPDHSAEKLQMMLSRDGFTTTIWRPTEPELKGKLVGVNLPWGWTIAFRLYGKDMPAPQWE